MRTAILVSVLVLLPGCPTPTQYGGPIAVDTEGFAVRMAWLCRWGMDGAKASACLGEPALEVPEVSLDAGVDPSHEQAPGAELSEIPAVSLDAGVGSADSEAGDEP